MRRNESSHDGIEGAGASQRQTKTLFPITSSVSTALLLCNAVALLLTREAGVGIQCLATTVRSTTQCFSRRKFTLLYSDCHCAAAPRPLHRSPGCATYGDENAGSVSNTIRHVCDIWTPPTRPLGGVSCTVLRDLRHLPEDRKQRIQHHPHV